MVFSQQTFKLHPAVENALIYPRNAIICEKTGNFKCSSPQRLASVRAGLGIGRIGRILAKAGPDFCAQLVTELD